ncbi:DUF1934 domain-containing protein [Fructilactobacillus sp. Tb1]|uniref:DUF1934 domain-containing protein n=1 Tax=Fructilactobacillus sp. Tb1 TaxID=3422304 RepID=UPI003D2D830D
MENEKKYQDIHVVVDTKITQDGETESHHFAETGQLAEINNVMYIRYVEHFQGQETPVTFKISGEHHVRLTRKAANDLMLEFVEGEKTKNHYQTPYGKMTIGALAKKVDVDATHKELEGNINVDYELYTNDEKVGDYQIKLHFNR